MAATASRPAPPSGLKLRTRPTPPPGLSLTPPEEEQSFEESDPGIGRRIGGRIFGTDVDDPRPYSRLFTIIAGALGGATLGGKGGAVAGSVAGPIGAAVGGGGGAILGSLAGTVAGAAAPEMVMELSEKLGLAKSGFREEHGLSDEDLATVLKGEALIDAATLGGVAAARLGGRAVTNAWTGASKASRKTAEEAARQNINLMPVQVGKRQMPRNFVSIFGRFPFIAGPVRKEGQKVENAIHDAFSNLPPRIAVPASMSDLSAQIFSDVKTLSDDISKQFSREYEAIYKLADKMKVRIKPEGTLNTVDNIIAKIGKETPAAGPGRPRPRAAKSLHALRKWLVDSVVPMRGDGGVIAPQSLKQMDALMENLDAKLGEFARNGEGLPTKYLAELRTAIGGDMMNLGKGLMGPGGRAPREIGRMLREVDGRFSTTMTDVLENATAKRFNTVQRRGVFGFDLQQATQTHVDSLADVIMRGASPESITELQRMVTPETMKKLAATVLERRLQSSLDPTVQGDMFNMGKFAREMGLGDVKGGKYLQTKRLLDAAGGLDIKEVEQLMNFAKAAGSVEIPDVSTFVARRAGIGGIRSVTTALVPALAAAGGASGNKSWGQLAIGGILLIGGGRAISKAISTPETARALRHVLYPEGRRISRRAALTQIMRLVPMALVSGGEWTMEQRNRADAVTDAFMESVEDLD